MSHAKYLDSTPWAHRRLLLNFVGFQLGWFASVLGGANGYWWLGPAVVGILMLLHLSLAEQARKELALAAAAMAIGAVGDSLLALFDVVRFASNPLPSELSPPWMIALWANFALTMRTSFKWLLGRDLLSALLGAIGGPLAYLAGERLGAISFGVPPVWAILILALFWGAATPLLFRLASERRA